jgi:hypothetical protein
MFFQAGFFGDIARSDAKTSKFIGALSILGYVEGFFFFGGNFWVTLHGVAQKYPRNVDFFFPRENFCDGKITSFNFLDFLPLTQKKIGESRNSRFLETPHFRN